MVEDSTSGVRVSLGPGGALAEVAAVLVDAFGSGATGIALAFVQVNTLENFLVRICCQGSLRCKGCKSLAVSMAVAEVSIISHTSSDKLRENPW